MKSAAALIVVFLLSALSTAQQHQQHPPPQSSQPAPVEQPPVPPIGQSQQAPGPKLRLQQLEEMALRNNPTLAQAQAEIEASRGRRLQAGLFPNPMVGYSGEEIRGGRLRGGQHGAFIEQSIVLGGKLGLGRKVFEQEVRLAEIEAEEQRLRVINSVRRAFYRALAAQELLALEKAFVQHAAEHVDTSRRLLNLGQADETEVLQAEIELQQGELAVTRRENDLRRVWRALAALVGNPALPLTMLEGNLEQNLPALEDEQVLQAMVERSPAVRIAQASVARSEAMVSRAGREAVPDLRIRAGLQQNRELLEAFGRPVGLQGFAEVGVQLPIFNRNQGNVQAARAGVERARQEITRVQLVLRERAAGTLERHRNGRAAVERYRDQIIPRARRAYEAMLAKWGQMAASYPQVLMAQRTLFHLQRDYITALDEVWGSAIALEGFLLTDGLEAPARPGEMDIPVREINLPTPRGNGEDR
jgi:cobalt-zinc-cadmium efflux system outer membrane protein